ncbi:hypothetical protein GGS26DRAFT_563674 [Hypomontagnella submonticulosa]|nr:hypothetical protein GGS26DRAFT_563674 [Hypomontagnella submonticulosa]
MRILSRIDGSICGAILSCRPPPSLSSTVSLHSSGARDDYKEAIRNGLPAATNRRPTAYSWKKHNISCNFIIARHFGSTVATLSGCRPSGFSYFNPNFHCTRKWNHSNAGSDSIGPSSREISPRDELLAFVDQYDDTSVEEHLEFLRDPFLRRYAPADGPYLTVSDRREDVDLQSVDASQSIDPEQAGAVRSLWRTVISKLRRPTTVDLDTIYDQYQALPEPRMQLLPARLRHQLLVVLGRTERKDSKSMLRYFSVVADVKNSGFPLLISEWNTAMSFASRYVGRSTEVEAEAALHLWREMEKVAGIQASDVTFNILFDVASKAGKLGLAEMIYQEMVTRGYQFNRYHHVSLIHYFGLKQDAGGVRAAYKEMVDSGELIDSIVLNCVISGFLASGEEDAAERVYEKMKVSGQAEPLPDRNYTTQKNITKVLMMFAKLAKRYPDMRPSFQRSTLMSPSLQTYRLLINHYGIKLGDLSKVAQFLDEMKEFNIPLHGAIFLALFKAFGKHGGAGSDWSADKLGNVWKAFLNALDANTDGLYISTWMAMAILRAFSRCSSRDQILDIYESLRSRWDLDPTDSRFMMDFLQKIMQQRTFTMQYRGINL